MATPPCRASLAFLPSSLPALGLFLRGWGCPQLASQLSAPKTHSICFCACSPNIVSCTRRTWHGQSLAMGHRFRKDVTLAPAMRIFPSTQQGPGLSASPSFFLVRGRLWLRRGGTNSRRFLLPHREGEPPAPTTLRPPACPMDNSQTVRGHHPPAPAVSQRQRPNAPPTVLVDIKPPRRLLTIDGLRVQ